MMTSPKIVFILVLIFHDFVLSARIGIHGSHNISFPTDFYFGASAVCDPLTVQFASSLFRNGYYWLKLNIGSKRLFRQ